MTVFYGTVTAPSCTVAMVENFLKTIHTISWRNPAPRIWAPGTSDFPPPELSFILVPERTVHKSPQSLSKSGLNRLDSKRRRLNVIVYNTRRRVFERLTVLKYQESILRKFVPWTFFQSIVSRNVKLEFKYHFHTKIALCFERLPESKCMSVISDLCISLLMLIWPNNKRLDSSIF